MKNVKLVYSSILLVTLFVDKGNSIRCYECSSTNNSMCLDPTKYDNETIDLYLKPKECQTGMHSSKQIEYFCRKIIQSILQKGRQPEVRITRGCAWVKHHKSCYKADNEDHLETVCQCFTNECNHAALNTINIIVALLSTFGCLVLTSQF